MYLFAQEVVLTGLRRYFRLAWACSEFGELLNPVNADALFVLKPLLCWQTKTGNIINIYFHSRRHKSNTTLFHVYSMISRESDQYINKKIL